MHVEGGASCRRGSGQIHPDAAVGKNGMEVVRTTDHQRVLDKNGLFRNIQRAGRSDEIRMQRANKRIREIERGARLHFDIRTRVHDRINGVNREIGEKRIVVVMSIVAGGERPGAGQRRGIVADIDQYRI